MSEGISENGKKFKKQVPSDVLGKRTGVVNRAAQD